MANNINLPSDLENLVLNRFDTLVHRHLIQYQPSTPEVYNDNGFKFTFHPSLSFLKKPLHNPSPLPSGSPFLPPKPHVLICPVGDGHNLLLNEFCVFRPMLLVTTVGFALQTEDLDRGDVGAGWAVLRGLECGGQHKGPGGDEVREELGVEWEVGGGRGPSEERSEGQRGGKGEGRERGMAGEEGRGHGDMRDEWDGKTQREGGRRYMVTYSCGYEAGASQMHRHLQIHPVPDAGVWLDRVSGSQIEENVEGVPYRHFAVGLEDWVDGVGVYRLYVKVLERAKQVMREKGVVAYNMVLTARALVVIPRTAARTAEGEGVYGINAAGIMGIITVRDGEERRRWKKLGYAKYLAQLGLPLSREA
ncbi:hypothetical protein BDZ85DRAFT_321407 [Elsinoe ampelina]|uniref:Uncharacterized protein n=1 Tax=Elsinoe ampelina TaxID=302913 RepID=A0A6A6G4X0_9PEZI|nr:hypothetical protein BDZ85DRAFT_321407 [Elsinoe ampelina]